MGGANTQSCASYRSAGYFDSTASSIAALSERNIYSITKVLGEDLCDYYHDTHAFQIAMIRYGSFTPCDFVSYGQRFLGYGVDRRDCVSATVRAAELLAQGRPLFGRYIVMPSHSWSDDDCRHFGDRWKDPLTGINPDSLELVQRYGIQIPQSLPCYDHSSTETDLDFVPAYDFGAFISKLKERDAAGALTPDSPRWRFEMGVAQPEGVVWPDQERVS